MQKFYFTYGNNETQPFKGGWTEVVAEDIEKAVDAYTYFHPLRDGLITCSSIYNEDDFKKTKMFTEGNRGHKCQERIVLERSLDSERCAISISEAIEKQVAKEPTGEDAFDGHALVWICPVCGGKLNGRYCGDCGQRIEWEV